MAQYDDPSTVSRFGLTGNLFIDSLFDDQAYFRNGWDTVINGKTAVTYSFPWADGVASRFLPDYGNGENTATTTGAVSATEAPGIAAAFQAWANVAQLSFTQVEETAKGRVGDIRIAFSSEVTGSSWGYTLITSDGYDNSHGDVWIGMDQQGESFAVGSYNFTAMMHEIGHALGLDHPFQGNIIPDGFDNVRYTIMSYTFPDNVWYYDPALNASRFLVETPMVYDIAAVQEIYGANTGYHSGNSSYAYKQDHPFFATIWDGGGRDVIDLRDFTLGCTVSLKPGSYSTLAYSDIVLDRNLGIAFGCTIENAFGGSAGDKITGNSTANTLKGYGGNDVLRGGNGNDTLFGGAGTDNLSGDSGNDKISGGAGKDTMTGGIGSDTFAFAPGDFGGASADSADRITDFRHVDGDRIALSAIDAISTNGSGDDAFSFIGSAAFGHHAGELRYEVVSGIGYVQGDTNGDALADFWIRVDGAPALQASDFAL